MKKLEARLEQLRKNSREALKHNSLVKINRPNLDKLIEEIKLIPISSDNLIVDSINLDIKQKIALTLLFGSINYCYVDPYTGIQYVYESEGYRYQRSSGFIKALVEADIDWSDFKAVSNLTIEHWLSILQLENRTNHLYDVVGRLDRLRTFADYLSKRIDLINFFETYDSYEKIYSLLDQSKLFEDDFIKRGQIVIMWLNRIAEKFLSLSLEKVKLTAMADYRLPQVLYNTHAIYLPRLVENKLMEENIFCNRDVEFMLRACTVALCEEMAIRLGVLESDIDERMWTLSQRMISQNKMKIPAMIVATDCY